MALKRAQEERNALCPMSTEYDPFIRVTPFVCHAVSFAPELERTSTDFSRLSLGPFARGSMVRAAACST